ncbi:MAG: hypothetical protein M3256_08630 [Actinomycetota bacterium]|nr:hypothetical protein [Actinomycetota bacterium]
MRTIRDAKARMVPGARLLCVANTVRPELDGTTRTVVEMRATRWRYRLDDGTESWGQWRAGITVVDADTITVPLGGPGRHVTLRFVDTAEAAKRWYLVRWEIDLEAASAVDAARKALSIQRDPSSLATFFTVRPVGDDGAQAEVDIDLLTTPGNETDR